MSLKERLLEQPIVYETFHSIFSREKLDHLIFYLHSRPPRRPLSVLDLGCGPGTNARLFTDKTKYNYLGIDLNPAYIGIARRKYGLNFECADITRVIRERSRFDLVLLNSVLHHLNNEEAGTVLRSAREVLGPEGECVVLDMIFPDHLSWSTSLQRGLIRWDRGDFCRTVEGLEELVSVHFRPVRVDAFSIRIAGIILWDMRLIVCQT